MFLGTLHMYYLSFQKGWQKVISKLINCKLIIDQGNVCRQYIHDFFIVSFDLISFNGEYFIKYLCLKELTFKHSADGLIKEFKVI